MGFTAGLIVGAGAGMVITAAVYMWLLKVALASKDSANADFLAVQRANGFAIQAIADAIRNK